jgi:hypothetical protein
LENVRALKIERSGELDDLGSVCEPEVAQSAAASGTLGGDNDESLARKIAMLKFVST